MSTYVMSTWCKEWRDYGCIGGNDFIGEIVNSKKFIEMFELEVAEWVGTINEYDEIGIEFPPLTEQERKSIELKDYGCIGEHENWIP